MATVYDFQASRFLIRDGLCIYKFVFHLAVKMNSLLVETTSKRPQHKEQSEATAAASNHEKIINGH